MKQLHLLWLGVGGMLALASCSREAQDPIRESVPDKPAFRMEVKTGGPATKTVIDEVSDTQYNVLWQAGDALGVFEVGNGVVQSKVTSDPLTSPGTTATFGLTLAGEVEAPYHYTFVYPASALSKKNDKYQVTLPANQTFAPNSFDASADVLVSEHLAYPTERPSTVENLRFARLGGTARMVIKAPTTSERIERISFSTTEANIVGAYYLTPATGELTENLSAAFSKNIQLTPAVSTTYSGDVVVWFRLAEVTLSNNFTLIVRTDSKTYSKTIDLDAAGRTLSFQNGKITKFGVDMTAVEGQDNTYEGNYAEFTVQDVRGKGITTSSYAVIEPYVKAYGDTWTGKVNNDNGGFGLRNCAGTNDSYLLLPKFKDGIATVTVTLSTAIAADKTLILASTASGTTGDIASLTTVADQLVYTFDLSAAEVSQAYLRSNGAPAYIQKVAVVGKGDSREALEGPANFTASLDPKVNNTIHLSWDTVPNAAAYRVDYTPEGESASSLVIEANEAAQIAYELEGLQYAKTYSFAITALADAYFNKDSATIPAVSAVTTAAQPAGLTIDVIDVALTGITGSSYTDWSGKKCNTAEYAGKTAKGNNAIQMRTSSHSGLYTTTSGGYLRSVTITLTSGTTNTVDIYAKNEAYTSVDDLWTSQGTKVGSVSGNGSQEVRQKITLADNYTHLGIRSHSGAVYVTEIRVEWANAALPTATVTTDGHDDVKASEATLSGSYSGAAGGIYEAGFYWDTSSANLEAMAHPEQVVTTDGSNDPAGSFSCKLGSLSETTTYYYKAYVLEFDTVSQTYVEHYGPVKSFTTLAKAAFTPGGWLEMPSFTEANMAGTSTSSLADLYLVTHYATMGSNDHARNFTMLYDPEMLASYWIAYPLCADHLGTGRNEDWAFDPVVPRSKQTTVEKGYGVNVVSANYNNQHYARGHQLPNADRNGVDEMMAQTYFSTNMTPQLQHGFNGGIWNNLEEGVRSVIKNNADTVYVVTGAAFRKKGGNETIQTITSTRDGKVLPVPNYYWKVLLRVKWSGNTVTSAATIGFWLEHRDNYPTGGTNYLEGITSVDQIEAWTGFDFFTNLSESIQATCENKTDWNAFKNY